MINRSHFQPPGLRFQNKFLEYGVFSLCCCPTLASKMMSYQPQLKDDFSEITRIPAVSGSICAVTSSNRFIGGQNHSRTRPCSGFRVKYFAQFLHRKNPVGRFIKFKDWSFLTIRCDLSSLSGLQLVWCVYRKTILSDETNNFHLNWVNKKNIWDFKTPHIGAIICAYFFETEKEAAVNLKGHT